MLGKTSLARPWIMEDVLEKYPIMRSRALIFCKSKPPFTDDELFYSDLLVYIWFRLTQEDYSQDIDGNIWMYFHGFKGSLTYKCLSGLHAKRLLHLSPEIEGGFIQKYKIKILADGLQVFSKKEPEEGAAIN